MRVLLAHNSLYFPSHGGGDKSNRLLMQGLAELGHDVRVVARVEKFGAEAHRELVAELARRGVTPREDAGGLRMGLNGVDVHVLTRKPHLRAYFTEQICEFRPDVILTSTDDPAHLLLDAALRSRAHVVYLVRATIAAPFGPDSSMPSAVKTKALRRVDGAVAVSESVAAYVRQWGGMDCVHVPISLLEKSEYPLLGRFDNRFVLMVNPCAVKGISIFLALADRFPEAEFAAVPTWGTTADDLAALRKRANVTVCDPVDDFDELLRQTRVVLVPSLWAEARSRVILEAMSRGIPVLASDVGGLAEAKLGVDYLLPVAPVERYRAAVDELMVPVAEIPEQDTRPWAAVLERLFTDREHWEALSAESRRAALEYARNLSARPFAEYLEKVVKAEKRREKPPQAGGLPHKAEKPGEMSAERRKLLALRLKASRAEMARRATEAARAALPGVDIEIFWDDGMWVRRVGSNYFPFPEAIRVEGAKWTAVAGMAEKFLRDADDYWFHVYKPAAGDVIVDIGAGRGEDVFAFSRAVGREGRVWAIEPHPVSFEVLKRFCVLNGLGNVTPLNYACVSEPMMLQIETLPVWESNFVRAGERTATSHPVEGKRFDDLCAERGIGRIDFLKMNIEGAEREALAGAGEALGRTRYVCVAAHDFRAGRGEGEQFRTLAFVREFLAKAGFELITRDDDPRYYVPYHVHGVRR